MKNYSSVNDRIGVTFFIYPDSVIEVFTIPTETTFEEDGLVRSLLLSIAKVLEYDVEFVS